MQIFPTICSKPPLCKGRWPGVSPDRWGDCRPHKLHFAAVLFPGCVMDSIPSVSSADSSPCAQGEPFCLCSKPPLNKRGGVFFCLKQDGMRCRFRWKITEIYLVFPLYRWYDKNEQMINNLNIDSSFCGKCAISSFQEPDTHSCSAEQGNPVQNRNTVRLHYRRQAVL